MGEDVHSVSCSYSFIIAIFRDNLFYIKQSIIYNYISILMSHAGTVVDILPAQNTVKIYLHRPLYGVTLY